MGLVHTTATSHPVAAWLFMSYRTSSESSDKMQKDPSSCEGKITSLESVTTFFEGEKKTSPVNHVTKAVFKAGAVYSCVKINV